MQISFLLPDQLPLEACDHMIWQVRVGRYMLVLLYKISSKCVNLLTDTIVSKNQVEDAVERLK